MIELTDPSTTGESTRTFPASSRSSVWLGFAQLATALGADRYTIDDLDELSAAVAAVRNRCDQQSSTFGSTSGRFGKSRIEPAVAAQRRATARRCAGFLA
jgi:hypothetical protein